MIITVNTLIINACKGIGLVGEYDPVDGQTANAALSELNSLITELNLQDFLAECRKEVIVQSGGSNITLGNSDNYTIKVQEPPDTIKVVSRKIGNRFMKLIPTDKATIYSTNRSSLATLYTYNQEYDEENEKMRGEIFLNTKIPNTYLVIFNKKIPNLEMGDEIHLSDMSINLLEEGLKARMAGRAKMPDAEKFEKGFTDYKKLVKENIATNRPSILSGIVDSSYLDPYYNLINGEGW